MLVPGSASPLLFHAPAGGGAATAGRSVRFNSADSAYLSRTPASAGNRRTWTISLWVKRSKLGVLQSFTSSANDSVWLFDASDKLCFYDAGAYRRVSTQVFRDASAWYHLVLVVDTPNSTAQNRARAYVNGTEITTWDTNTTITQNRDTTWNDALAHQIGANNSTQYSDLYVALFHNIDGQALTPSSFGETSATTGQWIAKTYSGTYGTNGFFLDFLDNSTAAALGYDAAGSNDWTVNNLSVTAGSGNDSLRDHPTSAGTSTGLGGEVSGNYATLNPLTLTGSAKTYANGNLEVTATSNNNVPSVVSTFGARSGKWYAEVVAGWSASGIGFINADSVKDSIESSYGLGTPVDGWTRYGTYIFNNGVLSSGLTSIATNDLLQLALDLDNGKAWFGINGTWENSGNPANGTNPSVTFTPGGKTFLIGSCFRRDGTAVTMVHNYGARAFAYTAPSGFSPLVDTLLPTPTIAKPNTVMDVALYTGNATARSITGLGFSPDFVWIKRRSVSSNHCLFDAVRGATKRLVTDGTDAEATVAQALTAFNSDGFSVGTDSDVNGNTHPIVAWAWDAGTSNATNTSGSITSTVRANISAGFSIIALTTPSSTGNYSVGHGLGVKPAFTIWKSRTTAGNYWFCQHQGLGNMVDYYIRLESTAAGAYSAGRWVNEPTSSLLYTNVGNTWNTGDDLICYCWAPVAGYSAFGSYTGNGSSDGPFVYTGFRPAVVLVKMSSSTGNWTILDDKREGYNVDNDPLYPNLGSAEGTTDLIDITSNGFKVRTTDATFNTNAGTYIYAAWASAPFPYSRAR